MRTHYTKYNKRLDVFGTDSEKDMQAVKKMIADKKIPKDITAIVYRKARNSKVAVILRGLYLDNFLAEGKESRWTVGLDDEVQTPPKSNPTQRKLRDILHQINEANSRQATYAGLLLYCTQTKRFLFFTPRNKGRLIQLLGDHPVGKENPTDIVQRVTKDDADFEIPPTSLIALMPLESDGTTYYSYLCFTNHEFKPNLSNRLIDSSWEDYTKLSDLKLHPSVKTLFEKDPTLKKLTKPADVLDGMDFDKLIDDILHST